MEVKVQSTWFDYNVDNCDTCLNKKLASIYKSQGDNLLNWSISSCDHNGHIYLRLTWVVKEKPSNVD